ncbi:hypothetical protein VIGAN_01381000 [Vigna angularis var. angularis]|uniref:Uncharacterized protein n=1 Tax=Vigna angularis var. angularis TaxID=157739 RepID=A0A0S3R5J0_PHAAN|nr:hypothetical protein VIGAN_01381000 [Vigna angularis var. angularis]
MTTTTTTASTSSNSWYPSSSSLLASSNPQLPPLPSPRARNACPKKQSAKKPEALSWKELKTCQMQFIFTLDWCVLRSISD